MKDDSDRVFDVSKPHRVSPDATSRPVIVGHQPMMNDPMVNNDPAPDDAPMAPMSPMPQPEHKAIPVHTDDEPDASDVSPTLAPTVAPQHPESVSAVATGPEAPMAPPPAAPTAEAPPQIESTPAGDMHLTPLDDLIGHEQHHAHHGGDLSRQQDYGQAPAEHQEHQPMPQPHRKGSKMPKVLLIILLLIVAGYLAVDSRLIKTSIKLPFHVFKQPAPAAPVVVTPASTVSSTVTPTVPTGFTSYNIPNTSISFGYPTAWGAPVTAAEGGFSSRSTTAKSDGTYAFLTTFATNKDVQVAVTSGKYLPPARAIVYYDYLQWCVGSNDSKFYKSTLRFNTTGGVDTPSTITCDQGPLTDATKLDDATIVQLKTKNPDGSVAGDLYTKNLKSTSLPVLRVKDAASTNGDDIKKLLGTITLTAPASTGSAAASTSTGQ